MRKTEWYYRNGLVGDGKSCLDGEQAGEDELLSV